MTDWPIIGGFIETLNWLTITIPLIVSYYSYHWAIESNKGKMVAIVVSALSFLIFVTVFYFTYDAISFPLWMGWFH